MTDLEAANKALLLIGVQPIGSLTDNTESARTVNRLLPSVKAAVLSEYPWSFCKKFAEPIKATGTPPPGFGFIFQKPEDCLFIYGAFRVRGGDEKAKTRDFYWYAFDAFRANRNEITNEPVDFVVFGDLIATKEAEIRIKYARTELNLANWTAPVLESLCARLASDIAPKLVGGQEVSMACMQRYQAYMERAIAQETLMDETHAQERYESLPTEYLDARG